MTKATVQIRTEPDGNPAVGIQTVVRKVSDNFKLGDTKTSDSNGIVTFEGNGSVGPITLRIEGQPGGDRSLASGEAMTSGVFSPAELPAALTVMGDGVIRGYLDELAVIVSGLTVTVAAGAAVISGFPVVCYTPTTFTLTRPASTRVDRVVAFMEEATGVAGIWLSPGTEGSLDPPALIVSPPDGVEIGLAQITVYPVQPLDPPTDERVFAGDRLDVVGSQHNGNASTTSTTGEAITHLPITLTLPRAVTYDIEAEITGQQIIVTPDLMWAQQATYGPTFNGLALSNPGQVAVDSTGRVLVADTGNNRLIILTSGGAYSTGIPDLGDVSGVCTDASNNIYVAYVTGATAYIGSWTAALALRWYTPLGVASSVQARHLTTDDTYLYSTQAHNMLGKYRCDTGSIVSGIGGPGTANGQFTTPWGIHHWDGLLYIVDQGNARVQRLGTTGVFSDTWSIPAGCRGIVRMESADVWVAAHAAHLLIHYDTTGTAMDAISTTTPSGVGIATGGVVWVSSTVGISTVDEVFSGGGYGQIALEIDGTISDYTGIGQRVGAVANSATASYAGPGSVLVRGYAKATLNTATFSGLTLSTRATPRG